MLHLSFSLYELLVCYLSMVVGNKTTNRQQRKMQVNHWQFQLPWRCGGTTRGASPNGARPMLQKKPLDASIGRVLALHCRSGHHGRRFRFKTQNTTKKLFLASKPTVDGSESCENFGTQHGHSNQLINATSFVQT